MTDQVAGHEITEHEIAGHKKARHEIAGHEKRRTWNCRTKRIENAVFRCYFKTRNSKGLAEGHENDVRVLWNRCFSLRINSGDTRHHVQNSKCLAISYFAFSRPAISCPTISCPSFSAPPTGLSNMTQIASFSADNNTKLSQYTLAAISILPQFTPHSLLSITSSGPSFSL